MKIPMDAIGAVAFRFEEANGNLLSDFELQEIKFHNLERCDPDLLVEGLRAGILENAEVGTDYKAQAYWALGKRIDRSLIPFLRERLAVEVLNDLTAAYQIMIALDNLKEPVFCRTRNGSYSVLDHDLNREDAEAYLGSLGRRLQQHGSADCETPPN